MGLEYVGQHVQMKYNVNDLVEAVLEWGMLVVLSLFGNFFSFQSIRYGSYQKTPVFIEDGVCDYCDARATEKWSETLTLYFQRFSPHFKTEACDWHSRIRVPFLEVLLPKYIVYGLVGIVACTVLFFCSLGKGIGEIKSKVKK